MDKRMALAAATMEGSNYGTALAALPRPVKFTYTPEVFGYLVGEALKSYNEEERAAWRVGFLASMKGAQP